MVEEGWNHQAIFIPLLPALVRNNPNRLRHRHLHGFKMLTHKNVSTTQIYADLVNAKKRETANKISLK